MLWIFNNYTLVGTPLLAWTSLRVLKFVWVVSPIGKYSKYLNSQLAIKCIRWRWLDVGAVLCHNTSLKTTNSTEYYLYQFLQIANKSQIKNEMMELFHMRAALPTFIVFANLIIYVALLYWPIAMTTLREAIIWISHSVSASPRVMFWLIISATISIFLIR